MKRDDTIAFALMVTATILVAAALIYSAFEILLEWTSWPLDQLLKLL